MSWFSLMMRLGVFVIAMELPAGALGFGFAGVRGAIGAAATAALVLLLAAWRAEKGILAIYRVRSEVPEGARRSLERVMTRHGGGTPRVFSFSDPAPQALVARGLASPGAILLSEGLLGALSEEELRELLDTSVRRLRSPGIRFQTLCARLAHLILEVAPRSWLEFVFGELRWHEALGAWGALRFMTVYSAAKFFARLGRGALVDAPRSLLRLPPVTGEIANPGTSILHFTQPWSSRSLLSL